MAERMPSDLAEASLLARTPQRNARVDRPQQPAARVAEHVRPTQVPLLLERSPHFDPQRDLARLARLRRPDLPVDHVLPDRDPSGHEIDILPTQTDQLPMPHAGA